MPQDISRYRRYFGGVTYVGVGVYLLDRRAVTLGIGGQMFEIGTVRYLGKSTEIDYRRAAEIKAAQQIQPSPVAVLMATSDDFRTAEGHPVQGHRILGWDDGRAYIGDLDWDYLSTLGYGVRDASSDIFALHDLVGDALRPMNAAQATERGLIVDGQLARRGQPIIVECLQTRPTFSGYAEADVILADGRRKQLVIRIESDGLPDARWLIGRTPREAEHYPAAG